MCDVWLQAYAEDNVETNDLDNHIGAELYWISRSTSSSSSSSSSSSTPVINRGHGGSFCSGFILQLVHFADIDMMFVQMFGSDVRANDVFVNAGLDRGLRLEALCSLRDAHLGC